MIILASAVRPAKAIITWLSRTQIFCTVLSSCSLAWNLDKKYRHIIKSIRQMPLFDKKNEVNSYHSLFFDTKNNNVFASDTNCCGSLFDGFLSIFNLEKIHIFNFFALIVCFSIWTIDGAAIALWWNHIISACSLYMK